MSRTRSPGRSVRAAALLSLALLLLTGCITVTYPPVPMDTKVGIISVKEKIPLKVAIFTNPSHREIYMSYSDAGFPNTQFPATGPTGRRHNATSQHTEDLFPIARELAKSSQEAFAQIFEQATVVGDLAANYDGYDAVIVPKLIVFDDLYTSTQTGDFSIEHNWEEIILSWKLVVYDMKHWAIVKDKSNKGGGGLAPLLAYEGQALPHRPVRFFFGRAMEEDLRNNGIEAGIVASESLAMVVKKWAALVQDSKEIRDYANQVRKSP